MLPRSECWHTLSPHYLLLWRSRAGKRRIAPEAAGAWSIIGHLLWTYYPTSPIYTWEPWQTYTDRSSRSWSGMHRALVVTGEQ
ncbi:hypothetical protein CK203_007783 [Vitis vinifera]|uniref:Uncharacterized protein n=1 Tax=Vitis vinifera TaxID=29760 RepID=A0A438K117_VITVI|nr:hypothetical protein CK203_007783 [Vitis vinifera]